MEQQPRRNYHAPARAEAAQRTRRRIRSAASRLFLDQGYAATSMRAIAGAAGVVEKTVYLQFSTKSALLQEVVETAIAGDDADPTGYRDWFQSILTAPDPGTKLNLLAAGTADLHTRTGELFVMARGAAAVDPDAAALWSAGKRGHRSEMTRLAENFAAAGMLPQGCDVNWAINSLYVLVGPETWDLVRHELKRSQTSYRMWLSASLHQQFTPS